MARNVKKNTAKQKKLKRLKLFLAFSVIMMVIYRIYFYTASIKVVEGDEYGDWTIICSSPINPLKQFCVLEQKILVESEDETLETVTYQISYRRDTSQYELKEFVEQGGVNFLFPSNNPQTALIVDGKLTAKGIITEKNTNNCVKNNCPKVDKDNAKCLSKIIVSSEDLQLILVGDKINFVLYDPESKQEYLRDPYTSSFIYNFSNNGLERGMQAIK